MLMLTPELLWDVHRAALGGKSSVTGASLPEYLEQCPLGAQGAHYAMALAAAFVAHAPIPEPPEAVTPEEEARIRVVVAKVLDEAAPTGASEADPPAEVA